LRIPPLIKKRSSLDKAFDVLFSFREESRRLLTVQEISEIVGVPQSSGYRYISKLCERGLLQIDPSSKKYRLGMTLFELGSIVYQQMGIREVMLPYMKELYEETKESVFLTILEKDHAVCIEKIESDSMLRISIKRGDVMPLHAGASAKILMAYLPEAEQDKFLQKRRLDKFTSNTITEPKRLKKHLKDICLRGYAFSNQELQEGARAIAAPVRDISGNVIAGLCIAGPMHRFQRHHIERYKRIILDVSTRASRSLGLTRK
jgi:DNA-binding IclR family transcriptional regulator